jgi:hypothetical protein
MHKIKKQLIQELQGLNFAVNWIATDGDTGMDSRHKRQWQDLQKFGTTLPQIVHALIAEGKLKKPLLVTDFLHALKNARTKISQAVNGLAMKGRSQVIKAEELIDALNGKGIFDNTGSADKMRDDLALKAFGFGNMAKVAHKGHLTGAYYILPYEALNMAFRAEHLALEQRKALIDAAFTCFNDYMVRGPRTGSQFGILERADKKSKCPQSLWSFNACCRGVNLCVALYYALEKWQRDECAYPLALDRIGTHPLECVFGMTRMTLNHKTDAKGFMSALVKGILRSEYLRDLKIGHCNRRFKQNVAGVTLRMGGDEARAINVDFEGAFDLNHHISCIWEYLQEAERPEANGPAICEPLARPFKALVNEITLIQKCPDKIPNLGRAPGIQIVSRLRMGGGLEIEID